MTTRFGFASLLVLAVPFGAQAQSGRDFVIKAWVSGEYACPGGCGGGQGSNWGTWIGQTSITP